MNPQSLIKTSITFCSASLIIMACGPIDSPITTPQNTSQEQQTELFESPKEFLQKAETQLAQAHEETERSAWLAGSYITVDTEIFAAKAREKATALEVAFAQKARFYDGMNLPFELQYKLEKLKHGLTLPSPKDAEKNAELATLSASLEGRYGKGIYCPAPEICLNLNDISKIMAESRDPEKLLDAWKGWHKISVSMKQDYARLVEIANEGARELGYDDVGVLWRSQYDMPAEAFASNYDHQWQKIKPLYDALHCHVRTRLNKFYGNDRVPLDRPIPAHLLGNVWAQNWINIYDLVAPDHADPGYNLGNLIEKSDMSEIDMVKTAEKFFTSLGFDPLPETFWERSIFVKPRDRDMVCHPSAWNIDGQNDLRIKMCIQKTGDDFNTIHHELGHNFYQRAYNHLPHLYREGANDGFHEAIGDAVALSITPKYLVNIGLLDKEPDASKDIGLLLYQALDKIAFLPFGLLVDKWRWDVFSGATSLQEYNAHWWHLRTFYQGVEAPIERSEADFDPGSKYHIPANTPYARYFLALIQQFQFHRALCKIADNSGPLHRCSIYNNRAAGKRLQTMLVMGSSRPWPDAMEALTGQRVLDADAVLDYFKPLKEWLDAQNKDMRCGWRM